MSGNHTFRELARTYFDVLPKDTISTLISFLDSESCQIVCHPNSHAASGSLGFPNFIDVTPCGLFNSLEFKVHWDDRTVFETANKRISI